MCATRFKQSSVACQLGRLGRLADRLVWKGTNFFLLAGSVGWVLDLFGLFRVSQCGCEQQLFNIALLLCFLILDLCAFHLLSLEHD